MLTQKGIRIEENVEDVKKYLSIVNYPAKKVDIFATAIKQGANMNVMTLIQSLPDQQFHTPKEVLKSIGLN